MKLFKLIVWISFSHFGRPKPVFPRTVFTGKYHGKNRILSKTLQPWWHPKETQVFICNMPYVCLAGFMQEVLDNKNIRHVPTDTWRNNNAMITSKRRRRVTLLWHRDGRMMGFQTGKGN